MKKRILLSFLACGLSAGILSAAEQAVKEIYVSQTTGKDSNNGSISAPFKTVEVAIFSVKDNTPTKINLEENIVFDLEAPLNLDQNKQVEIVGKNTTLRAHAKSAIDGGEGSRILRAAGGCDIKVSGITFKNGRQVEYILGGAIFFAGNKLEVDNCRFIDNQAGSAGGAIGARGKEVIVTNSYFEGNNIAGGGAHGAAIMQAGQKTTLEPCSLVVKNCTFNKNTLLQGGQGSAIGGYDCTIPGAGGGYVNLSYLEVSNCTFLDNATTTPYQAALDMSHSALSLQDCYIVNNTFSGSDGAFRFFYNEQPFYFINNVVIAKKAAILNEMKNAQGRESLIAYNNVLIGDERGVNEFVDDECLTTKAAEYNNIVRTSAQLPVASLGLATILTTNENGISYLEIISATSPLVNAGMDNSASVTTTNVVPALDARGGAPSGKKDIGAFEYGAGTSITEDVQADAFYTISRDKNTITVTNLESAPIAIKVVTVDGKTVYNTTIVDEAVINAAELYKGVVIINLNNGKASKSIKAIL